MRTLRSLAKYHEEAYQLGHFPSLTSLLGKQKIYAYYGFLGDRNFGDELVYEAAKRLFHPAILLPIKRRMPAELALFARAATPRFLATASSVSRSGSDNRTIYFLSMVQLSLVGTPLWPKATDLAILNYKCDNALGIGGVSD